VELEQKQQSKCQTLTFPPLQYDIWTYANSSVFVTKLTDNIIINSFIY